MDASCASPSLSIQLLLCVCACLFLHGRDVMFAYVTRKRLESMTGISIRNVEIKYETTTFCGRHPDVSLNDFKGSNEPISVTSGGKTKEVPFTDLIYIFSNEHAQVLITFVDYKYKGSTTPINNIKLD